MFCKYVQKMTSLSFCTKYFTVLIQNSICYHDSTSTHMTGFNLNLSYMYSLEVLVNHRQVEANSIIVRVISLFKISAI